MRLTLYKKSKIEEKDQVCAQKHGLNKIGVVFCLERLHGLKSTDERTEAEAIKFEAFQRAYRSVLLPSEAPTLIYSCVNFLRPNSSVFVRCNSIKGSL